MERKDSCIDFWNGLDDYICTNGFVPGLYLRKPNGTWRNVEFSNKEAHYVLRINTNKTVVEFYIDRDKNIFDRLYSHKNEIESQTGLEFIWERGTGKCSKLSIIRQSANPNNETNNVYKWYVDTVNAMHRVIKQYL